MGSFFSGSKADELEGTDTNREVKASTKFSDYFRNMGAMAWNRTLTIISLTLFMYFIAHPGMVNLARATVFAANFIPVVGPYLSIVLIVLIVITTPPKVARSLKKPVSKRTT